MERYRSGEMKTTVHMNMNTRRQITKQTRDMTHAYNGMDSIKNKHWHK